MNKYKFDSEEQADLLSAAVRLYESEMYELCMNILHILMSCNNKEAYVLAGHCISCFNYSNKLELSNKFYEISCELGSSVGCYNLFLNYKKIDNAIADEYLKRAKELGWED